MYKDKIEKEGKKPFQHIIIQTNPFCHHWKQKRLKNTLWNDRVKTINTNNEQDLYIQTERIKWIVFYILFAGKKVFIRYII